MVVCLPLSSFRVIPVEKNGFPAKQLINVDLPTPDEPIKDAVLRVPDKAAAGARIRRPQWEVGR